MVCVVNVQDSMFLPEDYKKPKPRIVERLEDHWDAYSKCSHRSPNPRANTCSKCSWDAYQYREIEKWCDKRSFFGEKSIADELLDYIFSVDEGEFYRRTELS